MRGKWAAGIEPRNFTWIFQGQLAAADRPGGATRVHRQVRREEELRWLKNQKFTRVISLFALPLSNRAYDDHGMTTGIYPITNDADQSELMTAFFTDIRDSVNRGEIVLLHADEVSDRLLGLVAGYLIWSGRAQSDAIALAAVERLFRRSISIEGRNILKTLPERS